MKYQIEILAEARKQIKKLQKRDLAIVTKKIDMLSEDPRPHGYKKLEYYNEYFRIHAGRYRVIYQIADVIKIVTIVEVKIRNEKTY